VAALSAATCEYGIIVERKRRAGTNPSDRRFEVC
jgi:hypothetical protein